MRLTLRILLIATAALIIGFRVSKQFSSRSTGFYIELPAHTSQSQCGDFDVIVLQISKEHSLTINSERVTRETVGGRLHDIYRVRAERLLLIRADPDLSFQEVAGVIDVAQGAVENLYVTLITPGAEKEPCLFILVPRHPQKPQLVPQ
jgi:biopolymer transport protein ExbD